MTPQYERPWFDALSEADKKAYHTQTDALVADLQAAAAFLVDDRHSRAFPVRSYQPEVDLQYFVNDADADPRGTFEALARNVVAAGGSTFDRSDAETNSVQHIAELRFGSGRVAYRVVWIERTPTDAV